MNSVTLELEAMQLEIAVGTGALQRSFRFGQIADANSVEAANT